jgi:DNA polymerase-4
MDRSIIHLNVADFAVAVERCIEPRLRHRPVIVAPAGAARAVVYDMSEEAFRAGVQKGMPLERARRLCRDAAVLAPHPDRYERAMAALWRHALPFSPRIEAGDADGHLFVDATGTGRLLGPPVDVAWRLHRRVRRDLGLDPIWSVAPNKLVAKVASRLVKPSGEYIVGAGEEAPFLAPLPVVLLPGLERDDLTRLFELNLRRVARVAALSRDQLEVPFGRRAGFVHETVHGIDATAVLAVGEKPPTVVLDHVFGADAHAEPVLEAALYRLVERAGAELRRRRRAARRLVIVLDHSDGQRRVRQMRADPATANDLALFALARRVLALAWTRRVRVRRLRLVCDRLVFPPAQLGLFAPERVEDRRRENLVAAIDRIRQRFGDAAVQVGRTLQAASTRPSPTSPRPGAWG